jgi:BED zinc finger
MASDRKRSRASSTSTSIVWKYFDLHDAKGKVTCKECKQELCYNRNTSVMREHLKRKHVYLNLTDDNSSTRLESIHYFRLNARSACCETK